ncbi:MAG: hypothetical protein PHE09_01655 [Oscillospiraceae bacterium]|nr:hypothetical protein [Oscillospiraceae bacterium]
MNPLIEFDEIILEVTKLLGKPVDKKRYEIIDRGMPHEPKMLPFGKMGIYTFWHNGIALKIGKAGSKSNARFMSQHYNPKSAQSTLAASILSDQSMTHLDVSEANIGDWIKRNCRRIDILLDVDLGIFTLELIEAALHYKYEPKYEGFLAQR